MTHAAQVLSFSNAVVTWRPLSLAIFQRKPSSPLLTCRCNLGDKIASTSEELQSRKELSPKELHHLRKKKERKVLRKLKNEMLEKKRLEELAKLPALKPSYAMLRFERSNPLEGCNKPRKKRSVVSPRHEPGAVTSSSGEKNESSDSRWSDLETVYRDSLKSSGGGSDMSSVCDGITGSVRGTPEEPSEGHSSSSINSENLDSVNYIGNGSEISGTGVEYLEHRESKELLQEQDSYGIEVVNLTREIPEEALYRKVAKVLVGQRNGVPVYLSAEDDDGRDKRRIRREDLNEEKQLEWLAKQLNCGKVRTDGVHFSRLMRSGGLKVTDGRAVILLQLLGACGNWRRAMQVVDWLNTRHQYPPMKSRYVYTTLLAVLGQTRRPTEALKVFKVMCEDTITYPDMAAYHCIAVVLGQAGYLEELLDVIPTLRQAPKIKQSLRLENHGALDPDIVIFNAVLNACVSHKDWKCALWVFDEIRKQKLQPNSASYGLAIEVMVKAGKLNLAFETLEKMETDCCHPNSITYKILVEGLGGARKPEAALALVKRMEQRGIVPSSGVYFALARTLCMSGRWKEAILQVGRLIELSDKPLVETYTGLITACEKAGHWQDAISVFQFMQEVCAPNIGTYNIMIALYGRHNLFSEAEHLFDKLKVGRLSPKKMYKGDCRLTRDNFTYDAMLGACAVCGKWENLESTYKQMLLQGYELNWKRHSWIIEALEKAGKHALVESMLTRILSQNGTVTSDLYQIMICSCTSAGRDEEAFNYLRKMVKENKSISSKQLEMLQQAACSLFDADRPKFLDLLDLLQVSSDFTFERSGKAVSSHEGSSKYRFTYKGLRPSMITHEKGRTSYQREAFTIQEDNGKDSAMTMGSNLGCPEALEEEFSQGFQNVITPAKGRKQRKHAKPTYRPDPDIPGWELLWSNLDRADENPLDASLF